MVKQSEIQGLVLSKMSGEGVMMQRKSEGLEVDRWMEASGSEGSQRAEGACLENWSSEVGSS